MNSRIVDTTGLLMKIVFIETYWLWGRMTVKFSQCSLVNYSFEDSESLGKIIFTVTLISNFIIHDLP